MGGLGFIRWVGVLSVSFTTLFVVRYCWYVYAHDYPLAPDFTVFWNALQSVLRGESPYNNVNGLLFAEGSEGATNYYPFLYAPQFLFFLWPLGSLSLTQAVVVASLAQVGLWLWVLCRKEVKGLWPSLAALDAWHYWAVIMAVSSPFLASALMNGQMGVLISSLIVLGLAYMPTRPYLAGAIVAVGAFKPLLFIPIGIYLLVARRYRVIMAGVGTYVFLALASMVTWGAALWPQMWEALLIQATIFQNPSYLAKYYPLMVSPYTSVMMVFGHLGLAKLVQFLCFFGAAIVIVLVALRQTSHHLQLVPLLCVSIFMMSFYAYQYDMLVVTVLLLQWLNQSIHAPLGKVRRLAFILAASSAGSFLVLQSMHIPIGMLLVGLLYLELVKETGVLRKIKA